MSSWARSPGASSSTAALFEAVADTLLANDEIRAAHAEVVAVSRAAAPTRAKEAGAVREDIGAMDVLMLVKGVFEAASAFASSEPGMVTRQLDLVRAAISAHAADQPLRGRPPTLADIERTFPRDDKSLAEAG